MGRRAFLALVAGAVASLLVATAQDVSPVRQVWMLFSGTDHQENASTFRHVAILVDRILRGTGASNLPVQPALKLERVINLETAKALGLTIPPILLARADEVIE